MGFNSGFKGLSQRFPDFLGSRRPYCLSNFYGAPRPKAIPNTSELNNYSLITIYAPAT